MCFLLSSHHPFVEDGHSSFSVFWIPEILQNMISFVFYLKRNRSDVFWLNMNEQLSTLEKGIFRGSAPPFIMLAISITISAYIMRFLILEVDTLRKNAKNLGGLLNLGPREIFLFCFAGILAIILLLLPGLCIVRIYLLLEENTINTLDKIILILTYLLVFGYPIVDFLSRFSPIQTAELPTIESQQ